MYENGWSVERDQAEAMKWYRKAAEQGNARAQAAVGTIYGQGWGVKRDDTEAAKWLRMAADQGDAEAQLTLGLMYEDGRGIKQDYAEAYFWENLGIKAGAVLIDDSYGERQRQWDLRLSLEQRAAIEKRIEEWQPTPANAIKLQ